MEIDEIVCEIDDYKILKKKIINSKNIKLRITHKYGAKNFAEHSKVLVLNQNHDILGNEEISEQNLQYVINSLKLRGITEGLYVVKNGEKYLNELQIKKLDPKIVRHLLTISEKSFTATGEKLNSHWPIFEKYKKTGYGSIIRATMTLHQVCMSRCQFCSTIGRNKKDTTTLNESKEFVEKLYSHQAEYNKKNFPEFNKKYNEISGSDIRLKGLILSGGGQPNLWPHFEEFVDWLSKKDISLGLITNGFPKKVSEKIYNNFDWIRLSITPEDASSFYPKGKFNLQYIPKNILENENITLGLSYVYGPWTDDDILNRIDIASKEWGCEYVRVLTDCNLSRDMQILNHKELAERLFKKGFIDVDGKPTGKIFHQLKYHSTKEEAKTIWDTGQCYLQSFNTFWDTTGHEENGFSYCYPCDSVTVLAEGNQDKDYNAKKVFSERKFNYNLWGTVKNTEVEKLFTEKVKSYFDPREICSACLFHKNNRKVKELIYTENYDTITVDPDVQHVNFP